MTAGQINPAPAVQAVVQPAQQVTAVVQPSAPVQVLLSEPERITAVVRPPEAVVAQIAVGQGPAGRPGASGSEPVEALAGELIRAGQPAYINPANAQALLASNVNNITSDIVGLAVADVQPGFVGRFRSDGALPLADWTAAVGQASLVPGGRYFLGAAPGTLTTMPDLSAGCSLSRVGVASSGSAIAISLTRPLKL